MAMHFPAIITLLSLVLFFVIVLYVGYARTKYGIKAPATTGNQEFERVFRVQMNTLENLILFLPALWLFSHYVSPLWAGLVGVVWLIGRIDYAFSYSRNAEARSRGYAISALAFIVLLVGAALGVVLRIMAGL
ncbi:glutathione S-transferase [Cellvibrio zantedeschiae]|uniref:Glutathione S-transferase n=1 Tax=Cellvibrio zantedeschiae TaxID=1237077 RepID=A0ABQ3B5M8_9GAMM|nr:MAPEG family protein [Cellvibrio zantedeschiae]GGY78319.1 glutathione S-transferase [Cellvibrio zantedeschiae]